MELTEIIKLCRGDRTQMDFARDMGVSRQSVNHWESGKSVPAQKWMEKMGIRGEYVLEETKISEQP